MSSLLERLAKQKDTVEESSPGFSKKGTEQLKTDPYEAQKAKIHSNLMAEVKDGTVSFDNKENEELLKERIFQISEEVLNEEDAHLSKADRLKITNEVVDEVLGYGPISSLIRDQSITEIMVNGPDQVYVEKNGKLFLTAVRFKDSSHIMQVIDKIISPIGRRIDESSPMVDARLPNGSRVNAIIPPLSLNGPTITIRKFSETPYAIKDLINFGTISPQVAMFLKVCVESRQNIIVSGGTGSGKTTTLNVISTFIPGDERIVTIEDAAELQMSQEHVVRLETRPVNLEGKGEITIRDLVRNALRMRPDRIVVGEVRSGEALDMLQAMNTGHDGSLTTGHANSPRDMLARLETMVLMAGMDLPLKAIREQVASAIDIIIQQARMKDGSRKITHVTEIVGMEGEVITLQDIFVFKQTGRDDRGRIVGSLAPTGIVPHFMEKLEGLQTLLPKDLFIA